MQDRFKFRAWDKDNKKYIYDVQECLGYSGNECDRCFGNILDSLQYEVEQCTGLRDENGKLIYEGDIVQPNRMIFYSGISNLKICFHNGAFFAGTSLIDDSSKIMKVIGNIHENPELLGDEHNEN